MASPTLPGPGLRVALETLGCKLNLADTELLAEGFVRAGFRIVPTDEPADVYVLNTCSVTHVADRKARRQLRATRRSNPDMYLVATGCYAQRAPGDLTVMPEVDLVLGNIDKEQLVAMVVEGVQQRQPVLSLPALPMISDDDLLLRSSVDASQVRTFLKIQEGCNDYCSYCIIPKTRGASRYFEADAIIRMINERAAAGFREVVLTGTQLGDYGIDSPGDRRVGPDHRDQASEGNPLARLLHRILAETEIPRIRLSSLQPQDVTPQLLSLWANPRLCRHFHLPLQSGADPVLTAMRRRYRAAEYDTAVERIRSCYPDASITTDLIVGFPGETDGDFDTTYRRCTDLDFADIHVFPYSERPGTLATRLQGSVAEPAKNERLQRLLSLAAESNRRQLDRSVGSVQEVLWEKEKRVSDATAGAVSHGLTGAYQRVYTDADPTLAGTITRAHIEKTASDGLWGTPLR